MIATLVETVNHGTISIGKIDLGTDGIEIDETIWVDRTLYYVTRVEMENLTVFVQKVQAT